ncbi:MAG TPA: DUF1553 domain-containing protein, partial [Armatimonadota bacterium]|nr:DUF1553 domain-containing protein [Armatimonadota bacterium]
IRNNVYDVFQLFDFADPAVLEGNRPTTTVAPQALFMMNSELVQNAAEAMAGRVLERGDLDDAARVRLLYLQAYARPVKPQEATRAALLLARLERAQAGTETDPAKRRRAAWTWLCQSLMAANEFLYVR